MSIETPNLALATANTLTDRKAYDIASWLYDIAQWLHEQGEPPADPRRPRSEYDRLAWAEYDAANDKRRDWEKTPAGIMDTLKSSIEETIGEHVKLDCGGFKEDMNRCIQTAAEKLEEWLECWRKHQGRSDVDSGEAECQKLIERGKFFFSFWMPKPVAAAVVKIRGGKVEEEGSGAAGYTLTPTASTSPRLTL